MAISWKLALDVWFVLLVTGAVGLTIFVQQKEVFTYINMSLVSILCVIYSIYFNSVRKIDLMSWLDENRFTGGSCIRRIRGNLRIFMSVGLPYWEWKKVYIVITLLYLPFTALMLITAATAENTTMSVTSTILAILSILYVGTVVRFSMDLKMRFKVKLHGGSLSIFAGVFLMSCKYGVLLQYLGGALIIVGIYFIYDMWKQYSKGVNLRFVREPVENKNAAGTSSGISDSNNDKTASTPQHLYEDAVDTSAADNDDEIASTSQF